MSRPGVVSAMSVIMRQVLMFALWLGLAPALSPCAMAADGAAATPAVPLLSGRVVDNAELMSSDARTRISAQLKAHEDKTGNQVAVLTIPSLEGGAIEEFATRVFENWKLGKKGKDNGVLLVIVPKEKKLRIEVGYGLEGAITDVASSRIIRNVIAPHFKAGRFDQGVEEGVSTIISQLEGKNVAEGLLDADKDSKSSGFKEPNLSTSERILFGAFIFGIIGLFTVIGVVTPGMGWFLYLFLIPFWALFPMVIVGVKGALTLLGIYMVGFPLAKLAVSRSDWYKKRNTPGDRRSGSRSRFGGLNHSGGSWSSSSSSSSWGSSSGDSFSGSGGSSGGGGSSGDW